jgi:hypothetical protein
MTRQVWKCVRGTNAMNLGEAEGRESIDEFTELADVGEGLCMPRPHAPGSRRLRPREGGSPSGRRECAAHPGGAAGCGLRESSRTQCTASGRFSGQAGPGAAERSIQRLGGQLEFSARFLLGPLWVPGPTFLTILRRAVEWLHRGQQLNPRSLESLVGCHPMWHLTCDNAERGTHRRCGGSCAIAASTGNSHNELLIE